MGGAQEVVKQISERLAAHGHNVTVATALLEEPEVFPRSMVFNIEEFDISGNSVFGIRGKSERYQRFLIEGKFDIMMNYAAQQWATDLVTPVLNDLPL